MNVRPGSLRLLTAAAVLLSSLAWDARTVRASPFRAQAAADSIVSAATYSFGEHISFTLTGEALDIMSSVTLLFRSDAAGSVFTVEIPVEPSPQIEVEHRVDLAELKIPPFSAITYWWILHSESGLETQVEEQSFFYEDDQFSWQRMQRGDVTVHWSAGDPGMGLLLLDIAAEAGEDLGQYLPGIQDTNLAIYAYPSSASVRTALQATGSDWIGGHTAPELGVILVTAVNNTSAREDLRRSIPHEMAHRRLFLATGSSYANVPPWFSEGLATIVEATPSASQAAALDEALTSGSTIPFRDLCQGLPAAGDRLILAYAQSASLLEHIINLHGIRAIPEMIAAFNDGAGCRTVTERVFDVSLEELEREWLRSHENQSDLERIASDYALALALLLASAALMIIVMRQSVRGRSRVTS